MGAVIGEAKVIDRIVKLLTPIRDMFAAIFFVAIGMLFDASVLQAMLVPALAITAVTVIGKVASCSLATFLCGYSGRTSMQVGMGMAQLGEFSYIIAKLGQDLRMASAFLYPISVFAIKSSAFIFHLTTL